MTGPYKYKPQPAPTKPADVTPPITYTSFSNTETYRPPVWEPARKGADDHRKYRSRGF